MKTIILTKPYLLFETVNLLYAHVNGIDPSEMTTREPQALRPDQIASLLRQCCDGMDREQPELQYYFKERALEGCDGPYCLAFAMVYSFMLWENPDWQAHLASLEQYWLRMQQIGYLIHSVGTMGLRMEQSPDKQGVPLSSQIYQLGIPAEERLELIEVFTNYSSHLQTLRRLIAPAAEKLEQALADYAPTVQRCGAAWQTYFQEQCPAEEYLRQRGRIALTPEVRQIAVGFSLTNGWLLGGDTRDDTFFLFIGIGHACSTEVGSRGPGLMNDGEIFAIKQMGDKNRLAILRMLWGEESYCLELSQRLGMNPGTVSRTLTNLYNTGLLDARQAGGRTYYRTDRVRVEALFRNLLQYFRQED